jgi:hypothetical protein
MVHSDQMNQVKQQRKFILFFLLIAVGIPFLGVIALFVSRYHSPVLKTQLFEQNASDEFSVTTQGVATDKAMIAPYAATAPVQRSGGFTTTSVISPLPPEMDGGFAPGDNRIVVKNATLTLIVDNVRESVDKISSVIKSQNGVVTTSNIFATGPKDETQANLVLRVPVAQLDETLTQLRKLAAKVTQDTLNADDRTKQKIDIEARLNNLKATEQQLLSIMKQAKTVKDTLDIQRELTTVRSQIEVMTAELQNLSGDAAMSTIQVNLSSRDADLPTISSGKNSVWEEIIISLKDMVRLYRQLFILGIRTFILLLPIIVIGAISWFAWKRKARKS